MRWARLELEGLELGEGASYGRIMSGLVRVGDGRPEGTWEVDSCILRANKALQTFTGGCAGSEPSVSSWRERKRKCGAGVSISGS